MGIIYWLSLEAFALRIKDLKISDEEAAEMWARMSDPDCNEGDNDRECAAVGHRTSKPLYCRGEVASP